MTHFVKVKNSKNSEIITRDLKCLHFVYNDDTDVLELYIWLSFFRRWDLFWATYRHFKIDIKTKWIFFSWQKTKEIRFYCKNIYKKVCSWLISHSYWKGLFFFIFVDLRKKKHYIYNLCTTHNRTPDIKNVIFN